MYTILTKSHNVFERVDIMARNIRNNHTKEKTALQVIDERKVLEKDFKVYGTVEEPLFDAQDVAVWIEHSNHRMMLQTIDEDEKGVRNVYTLGGNQEKWFLTEGGLYEVLFQSRKPIAKAFKKEVKAILKELRTTGGFISDTDKFIEECFGDCPEDVKVFMKTTINQRKADKQRIVVLEAENDALAETALEWTDRATLNALIRAYGSHIGDYQAAWRAFKKELLYRHGINLNARITAYLNDTGKKTKPKTLDMLHDEELPLALSTAVALCRENNVNIDDILSEKIK